MSTIMAEPDGFERCEACGAPVLETAEQLRALAHAMMRTADLAAGGQEPLEVACARLLAGSASLPAQTVAEARA